MKLVEGRCYRVQQMGGVPRWWLVVVCIEDGFECVKWLCGMQW